MAENFIQPQLRESSSQRVVFGRPAGRFMAGDDEFLGVNISGGPAV